MAGDNGLLEVTDANFATEVEAGDGLHVVDFWAAWCGPCRIIGPIVEKLASDYSGRGVTMGKLDVDANPRTASRFNVLSIPTLIFFKGGEEVDRIVGLLPEKKLASRIDGHL